jgi:hypothetical protein
MSANVELVKRSIAAYSGRDFEAIRGMSHPDLQLDWSASRGLEAGVYHGVEEVIGFYRNFLDTFVRLLSSRTASSSPVIRSSFPTPLISKAGMPSKPSLGAPSSSRFAVTALPALAFIRKRRKPSKPWG